VVLVGAWVPARPPEHSREREPVSEPLEAVTLEIIGALVAHYELRDLLLTRFELTPDRSDLVRVSAFYRFAAERLGAEVSNAFRARVRRAARDAGWSQVTARGNVIHFRYCRERS
jgi:hypothetical protein